MFLWIWLPMYKPSPYLVRTYFPTYLPMYETYIFPTELVTKMKSNINSVEVHPQLSNNRHPVDGVLVGAGSLMSWDHLFSIKLQSWNSTYLQLISTCICFEDQIRILQKCTKCNLTNHGLKRSLLHTTQYSNKQL
jgi:hypothetical protein